MYGLWMGDFRHLVPLHLANLVYPPRCDSDSRSGLFEFSGYLRACGWLFRWLSTWKDEVGLGDAYGYVCVSDEYHSDSDIAASLDLLGTDICDDDYCAVGNGYVVSGCYFGGVPFRG